MRLASFILLSSVLPTPVLVTQSTAVHPIRFEDIAGKAGVRFIVENSPTPEKHQPETMPGGIALCDYDGDGLLDIYLVNGAEMPSLVKTGPKYSNRLFHNNGNGTFTDVTEHAGVAGAGYGMGAAVGDFDNDGWPDLFMANVNGNQLFHNNGNGTFTEVTAKSGLSRHAQWPQDVVHLGRLVRLQQRWTAGPVRRELRRLGSAPRAGLHRPGWSRVLPPR